MIRHDAFALPCAQLTAAADMLASVWDVRVGFGVGGGGCWDVQPWNATKKTALFHFLVEVVAVISVDRLGGIVGLLASLLLLTKLLPAGPRAILIYAGAVSTAALVGLRPLLISFAWPYSDLLAQVRRPAETEKYIKPHQCSFLLCAGKSISELSFVTAAVGARIVVRNHSHSTTSWAYPSSRQQPYQHQACQ